MLACPTVPEFDVTLNSYIYKNYRYPKQCVVLTVNAVRIRDTILPRIENNIAFHLIPRSHSAVADCAYGVLGNIDIRMYSWTTMFTQPPNDKTSVNDISPKNGSLKVKNNHQQIENNIAFHLIPRSHSAAAECAYRVLGNIDIRLYSWAIMPTYLHMTRIESKTYCRKTARYKWNVFHQQIENNIAFHLIPRSHSAAADCAYGVLGNIDIRMYSCSTMSTQPPNDKASVKDILWKNGSLKVKNISSADRKKTLPFIWCPAATQPRQNVHMAFLEHRYQDVFLHDHVNTASKWQDFS